MNRSGLIVLLSFSLPIWFAGAIEKDEAFEKLAKDYVEGMLSNNPEFATELGDHRFDDKLTDYSPSAREKELARAKQFRDSIKQFSDISQLTGANRVDARILAENIEKEIFQLEELKEAEWN